MKKYIFTILCVALVSACAKPHDGKNGSDGAAGLDGAVGATGASGTSCKVTTLGATGLPGDLMENGGALIECYDSTTIITNGAKGSTGATGSTGAQGARGETGASATIITTVKYCSSNSSSSASKFPEYGLCIGNHLYSVYWDGTNSWLALTPPGDYRSTSTTLPCNFTILVDCQVRN